MGKLESMRKACAINDAIFNEIVTRFTFRTEKDLANYILKRFRDFKVSKAYDPIVANNNSVIHAKPRDKKISRGFLVLDFGCKFNGWCSDMTRTIFVGKPSMEEKKLYSLIFECQKKCSVKVKKGVSCFDLEVLSRRLLGKYRKYYSHRLGHGIGKKVHEKPDFGSLTIDILNEGDVVTIEPGIYVKDNSKEFAIRIEDTLYVKNFGREVLCKSPRNLIAVSHN